MAELPEQSIYALLPEPCPWHQSEGRVQAGEGAIAAASPNVKAACL